MKKIIMSLLSLVLLFSISGCYTVAWQPGEELPVKEEVSLNKSSYYNVNDFGVFSYYYNSTWWLNEDYDFLLDNLTEVSDLVIITEDINLKLFEPIGGCPVVPPHLIKPIVSPLGKPINNSLTQKTKNRNENSNNLKIRNNNGSRNNSKGKGR